MAQEILINDYYGIGERFIDPHISTKVALEAFLAKEFFKGDFSRVIYSAQDIVFRRRIELLDSGKDGEQMNVTNLNLPFCSYMQVGDPEEDDRLATKNASLAVLGIYQEDLGKNLRTVAVKTKYKATLFFHRRDDIRLAHQLMFWEANPKHPLKMYITVYWRGKELQLPVNISIESINTTPSYNEVDWLKKARIFTMEVEFTIRSYQIHINTVDNELALPFRFNQYNDSMSNNEEVYFTEEAILAFSSEKFNFDINPEHINIESESAQKGIRNLRFSGMTLEEEDYRRELAKIPSDYSMDVLKGYFSESTAVNLNIYKYNDEKSVVNDDGTVSCYFDIQVKPADYKFFQKIVVLCPTKSPLTIEDCKAKSFTIDGLYFNSDYEIKILTYSKYGDVTTFNYKFTSKDSPLNLAPTTENLNKTVNVGTKLPGLVGMEW